MPAALADFGFVLGFGACFIWTFTADADETAGPLTRTLMDINVALAAMGFMFCALVVPLLMTHTM